MSLYNFFKAYNWQTQSNYELENNKITVGIWALNSLKGLMKYVSLSRNCLNKRNNGYKKWCSAFSHIPIFIFKLILKIKPIIRKTVMLFSLGPSSVIDEDFNCVFHIQSAQEVVRPGFGTGCPGSKSFLRWLCSHAFIVKILRLRNFYQHWYLNLLLSNKHSFWLSLASSGFWFDFYCVFFKKGCESVSLSFKHECAAGRSAGNVRTTTERPLNVSCVSIAVWYRLSVFSKPHFSPSIHLWRRVNKH